MDNSNPNDDRMLGFLFSNRPGKGGRNGTERRQERFLEFQADEVQRASAHLCSVLSFMRFKGLYSADELQTFIKQLVCCRLSRELASRQCVPISSTLSSPYHFISPRQCSLETSSLTAEKMFCTKVSFMTKFFAQGFFIHDEQKPKSRMSIIKKLDSHTAIALWTEKPT